MSRGIFRMSFRINGSGAGLVVGVADASESAKGMPASDVRAWGLHLSHGALYTKKAGSETDMCNIPLPGLDRPTEKTLAAARCTCYQVQVQCRTRGRAPYPDTTGPYQVPRVTARAVACVRSRAPPSAKPSFRRLAARKRIGNAHHSSASRHNSTRENAVL